MREKALEKLRGARVAAAKEAVRTALGLALLCFLLLLLRHRQHRLRLLHACATLLRLRQLREGRHYARVVVATR